MLPSPAMVVALVALFVAGAGSATAAKSLIDGADIKNNSITGKDVKNSSLFKKDFKKGQLPAGPRGLQGPQGAAGAPGPGGKDGFGKLEYVTAGDAFAPSGGGLVEAICPAGTYPTGGDAVAIDGNGPIPQGMAIVFDAMNVGDDIRPRSWAAWVQNQSGTDVIVYVDAICANASSPPGPPAPPVAVTGMTSERMNAFRDAN